MIIYILGAGGGVRETECVHQSMGGGRGGVSIRVSNDICSERSFWNAQAVHSVS